MRGEILHFDETQGFGFIEGEDGIRYGFGREDLVAAASVAKGTAVEFQPDAGRATRVFAISAARAVSRSVPQAGGGGVVMAAPVAVDDRALSLWGYFVKAITTSYFDFRGRARRKEYWGFYLFLVLCSMAVVAVALLLDGVMGQLNGDRIPWVTALASAVVGLGVIIPSIAIQVRRQHDIGLSGWFYLVVLIPYIGSLILFVFALISSQMHENKWGPVPAGIAVPPPYIPQQPTA